jgi:hypothetical protein
VLRFLGNAPPGAPAANRCSAATAAARGSGPTKHDRSRRRARAKIPPAITFHILRHTWASLAVMAGVPLMVVAKDLGHSDTRVVEKHYGHLAPSFITEAIRAGAPRYGVKDDMPLARTGSRFWAAAGPLITEGRVCFTVAAVRRSPGQW